MGADLRQSAGEALRQLWGDAKVKLLGPGKKKWKGEEEEGEEERPKRARHGDIEFIPREEMCKKCGRKGERRKGGFFGGLRE